MLKSSSIDTREFIKIGLLSSRNSVIDGLSKEDISAKEDGDGV